MVPELYQAQTRMESHVYTLLKHHGIFTPEDIELEKLCATYRIEVWDIEGRSRVFPHPTRSGWHVIAIDESLDEITKRLKIAHEFGHLLLHVGIQPDAPELLINWQESQANHFAEHLLMPFYMFDTFAFHVTIFEAPYYIAKAFRVPKRMAKERFNRFLERMYIRGYAHYI